MFHIHLSGNSHIGALITHQGGTAPPNWDFNNKADSGIWTDRQASELFCGDEKWFGYGNDNRKLEISANMIGTGCAKITFTNCMSDSWVKLYVGGGGHKKQANGGETKTYEWEFSDGEEIKFKEDEGIIRLDSFEEYACPTGKF